MKDIKIVDVAVTSTEPEVITIEKLVFLDEDDPGELSSHMREEIFEVILPNDLKKKAEREMDEISSGLRTQWTHSSKVKQ